MADQAAIATMPAPWPPAWGRWVVACTAAELVGMAAAASMAVLTSRLVGEPTSVGAAAVVMAGALLGGAVEGLAVGELQLRVLRTWLPGLSRARYVGSTVALAIAFWLLGMLPSTLTGLVGAEAADDVATGDPPIVLVALVAAVGGAAGGLAFGAVQGWALRGQVRHPWRWIRPNVVGWALAVAVITVGASSVPGGVSAGATIVTGLGVGLLAGTCVGVVTGQALPALDLGLPWWNRVVVDLLLSPLHVLMSRGMVVLRFRGRRSGASVTLPVQYAELDPSTFVVYVANAEDKTWWRSFATEHPVDVALRGSRQSGSGHVVALSSPEHEAASTAYAARQPRVTLPPDATLVVVRLDRADAA
jgi:hypothetical protein